MDIQVFEIESIGNDESLSCLKDVKRISDDWEGHQWGFRWRRVCGELMMRGSSLPAPKVSPGFRKRKCLETTSKNGFNLFTLHAKQFYPYINFKDDDCICQPCRHWQRWTGWEGRGAIWHSTPQTKLLVIRENGWMLIVHVKEGDGDGEIEYHEDYNDKDDDDNNKD